MPTKLRAFVASSSAPVKYVVGQRVEVEYKVPTVKLGEKKPGEIPRKRGFWYAGNILQDRGDNTYDVEYDDGEKEIRVEAVLIRPVGGAPSPTIPTGPSKPFPSVGAGRKSKSAGSVSSSVSSSKDFKSIDLRRSTDNDALDLPDEAAEEYKESTAPSSSSVSFSAGPTLIPAPSSPSHEAKEEHHEGGGDDDELVAGGGDESGCVKPWLGAVKPPTKPPAINPEAPAENLTLTWVHGYTSAASGKYAVSNNLFYNKEGDAIFPAAALGVKLSSKSGSLTQTYFQGHDDDILCLAVSKCRRYAATGQTASHTSKGKGHVCIWDAVSMTLLNKQEGCHMRGILCLSFSPDSTKLLTVGLDDDNTHIIFGSTNGWKKVDKVATDKGDKAAFLFSCWVRAENPITTAAAGESFNLVSGSDKNLHLWTLDGSGKLARKKGSISKKVSPKDVKLCCAANFNTKNGWKVAMGGADGGVYLFGGKECDASIPAAHAKDILTMAEGGPSCAFLVTGGADKTVRVWSSDLTKVCEFDMSPFAKVDATVGSLDVKADCSSIVAGTFGGEIVEIVPSEPSTTTMDLTGASASVLLYSHFRGELWGVATHPTDADIVATVGDDATLRTWSISQNKLLSTVDIGWPGRTLAWHPSGDAIAVGLFELVKGGEAGKGGKDKGKAKGGADGEKKGSVLIYSYAKDGDSVTMTKLASGCPSIAWIGVVRFSPAGNLLCVGSHDKKMYAYNVDSNNWEGTFKKEKYIFNKHSSAVLHMDFSADGKFIQETDQAEELLFLDPETGKQETSATKMAEYHGVDGVADKRIFATQTCILGWPVLGIWPPGTSNQFINSCDRSPNNKLIATSDDDGQVKIFRFPAAQENSKFKVGLGHSSHTTGVAFNASSDFIVSVGGNDKCVFTWRVSK